jgi:hypothetical protein
MQVTSQHHHSSFVIEVAGKNLEFRKVTIEDQTPTGAQIAAAAGFKPDQLAIVLHLLASGAMEDIRPDEMVTLSPEPARFIVAETDRTYFLTVDGARLEWPFEQITGYQVRKLAHVTDNYRLLLRREEQADQEIQQTDFINLDNSGIESFVTRKPLWKLNVQGVPLEIETPTISVRDAVVRAGLNPNESWHIYLKVEGQPKEEKTLDDIIDLRTPGIEKLRLTPKNVDNGEAALQPRRLFNLLPVDELHLNQSGVHWEACVTPQGRRWLVIHYYHLPQGYTHESVRLALEVPVGYPSSQIDMFYLYPPVALTSGVAIPCVEATEEIDGDAFQRWSRHRTVNPWNPATDNVVTQLALVEGCLLKEVGE